MKTYHICTSLAALSLMLFTLTSHADDITAVQNGNWSDTNTWVGGIVPGVNDDADIPFGIDVVVDTNVVIQFIYDQGTVTMAPNSTLEITTDTSIASETTLDASAIGNTVIYSANAYNAKPQNYYNLVFDGLGTFYNGDAPNYPATAMNIAGDLTISGTASIQAGTNFTIGGNLTIGTTNILTSFDCSVAAIVVKSNVIVNGFLIDGDGSLTNANGGVETNQFKGNVTVNPGATWNVSDVTTWSVGGNFTNRGTIKSSGFGSINFYGAGNIAGNPFKIKTISVNGTTAINTTVTLTTNTPTLNGTLVFDLASTNKIIFSAGTNTLYYNGNLTVINSGAAPASGSSYQLFSAPSYGGAFSSTTLPSLAGGLSWVNNLTANGSITVVGGSVGSPKLAQSSSGGVLTLSWDSATYPGYHVQGQTNTAGIGSNWGDTSSGAVSPFVIGINPTNPPVFFRLIKP